MTVTHDCRQLAKCLKWVEHCKLFGLLNAYPP
jgi:hypothetical protein